MARIKVDYEFPRFPVEKKIFGHFTEHAFKNIYGGMYDPESPFADEDGFRTDVIELLKKVNVSLLRYPGGNFVSNYHWEDGVGPKEKRKRVFDYAWKASESNEFGTVEFIKFCRKVGAEPLICVNMGSGTAEEAMHWVEYCNGTGDTYYANLRRSHGYEEPFNVKYWGLGNEMYGNWQFESLDAKAYAKRAFQFAKAIKAIDPKAKLIACGFQDSADWNFEAMKAIGPMCDYISAHTYAIGKGWGPLETDDYTQSLYIPEYMEMLNTLTISAVNAGMNIVTNTCKVAWDEWNMFGWMFPGVNDDTSYTMHNALITSLILNRFINNSDTIGMANYSTFVNINGAVSVNGEKVVKRAQYASFELMTNNIGDEVLESKVSAPTIEVPTAKNTDVGRRPLGVSLSHPDAGGIKTAKVSLLDCLATKSNDGKVYLSVINKDFDNAMDVEIDLSGYDLAGKTVSMKTIYNEDIKACNTLESPDNVVIKDADAPVIENGLIKVTLKKHSVNLITVE